LSEYAVTLDYLTLDEAMSQEAIDVVEIDRGGSVPELKVINKSGKMILILDGEELVGAKQNRIVNTTILIAANATTALAADVSFSLKRDRGYRSDQIALWDRISAKADRLDVMSDSMEMAAIYRKETPAIKKYVEKFELVDHQIGAVFLINGKVVGMDCFGKAETFSKTYRKLTESYALDAIDISKPEKKYKVYKRDAEKLLKTAASGRVESHASVGLGTDCRLESKSLTGFALAHKEQILHLSVFARTDAGEKGETHSPMAKASLRRRYRL
jgi:uncharacterized protein (DUF1330 family)